MADIDFAFKIGMESPQRAQKATLTVQYAGDTFTAAEGAIEIANGKVDGDSIS